MRYLISPAESDLSFGSSQAIGIMVTRLTNASPFSGISGMERQDGRWVD